MVAGTRRATNRVGNGTASDLSRQELPCRLGSPWTPRIRLLMLTQWATFEPAPRNQSFRSYLRARKSVATRAGGSEAGLSCRLRVVPPFAAVG